MKTQKIVGANYSGTVNYRRTACRAILVKNDRILLSHERKHDKWLIPGGGLEAGETLEECVIREVGEETGLLCTPEVCYLKLTEYYQTAELTSYYFICTPSGRTEMKRTEREISIDAQPEWIPLKKAVEIYSKHADYTETDEERRGLYLREYTGLLEYMDIREKADF